MDKSIRRLCFTEPRYGSLERFLRIIIENYAGDFPLCLAPVQVRVLPISEKYIDYAKRNGEKLMDLGLRAEVNAKDDRIGYKIRESESPSSLCDYCR